MNNINVLIILAFSFLITLSSCNSSQEEPVRERISINSNWKFFKYESADQVDKLIYDIRPEIRNFRDDKDADSKPTEAEEQEKKRMF